MTREPIVFVVDDDEAVRHFLRGLIVSVGLRVETYASAREFLDAVRPGSPGCLLLDIRMPGMSGLELQRELAERSIGLPVIILTGHGDVQLAVHAMKAGAVDFIEKPFNNELLLDRVQKAVAESVDADSARLKRDEVTSRMDLLTPRERQVLDLVVAGETNKGAARRLGISEKTVEIHRARVMDKMRAKSLVDLVKTVAMVDLG
ncbi:MAG: response regulator transcription factor [Proteobacteria bacterium]|nr:response regulator transcription factor [Pseudomonadota bacterium]